MRFLTAAFTFSTMLTIIAMAGTPADACTGNQPIYLAAFEKADVLVAGRISNYRLHGTAIAKFDVLIEDVLIGNPPQTVSATWVNPNMALPESMPAGLFLVPLVQGTTSLAVLQPPCAPSYILASNSQEAVEIRRRLHH
ncbi:MAG: hypothetical protein JNL25_11235 [Rhodospirillaceae bacterium]|nr:hypothetical protein [Rhodospirillaceae bacterium]